MKRPVQHGRTGKIVRDVALGSMLVLSSAFQVLKYLGPWGLSAYALLVLLLLPALRRRLVAPPRALPAAGWLAAATVLGVVLMFAVIYPIADSGVVGGSDRDDALNAGAAALLDGRYPYGELTYLDNPISPLPGALFLAIPFVLMGNAAYQSFFWLPVFMWVTGRAMGSLLSGVLLSWAILILSPANMIGIVTGDDLLTNSIQIFVFTILLIHEATRRRLAPAVLLAVLLGVAMSSRPNYVLLLPLLFAHLRQHAGLGAAVWIGGIVAAAAAVVTVPFYLHAPEAFSPLHIAGTFSSPIPHSDIIVPILAGLLAVALGRRPMDPDGVALCGRFALVGFLLVLAAYAVRSAAAGVLVVSLLDYGRLFLVFGAFAAFSVERHAGDTGGPARSAASDPVGGRSATSRARNR